jgi:ATP-dependent DNA helicase RecG
VEYNKSFSTYFIDNQNIKWILRSGYIESWGRGTVNIIEYLAEKGIPAPEFKNDGAFTITFRRNASINIAIEIGKPLVDLSETQQAIVDMMKGNGKITIPEIVERMNISRKTVAKHIAILQEIKIIKRNGGRKNGTWIIASIERGDERGDERGKIIKNRSC